MEEKSLIIYYSHSDNTKTVAQLIQKETGGDLIEINLKDPYPKTYNALVKEVKSQMKLWNHPVLDVRINDLSHYKKIYIGSPNWWNSIALPVKIFLSSRDFRNNIIIPFCTHGGGGKGNIFKKIRNLTNAIDYKEGLSIYGNGGLTLKNKVKKWLVV